MILIQVGYLIDEAQRYILIKNLKFREHFNTKQRYLEKIIIHVYRKKLLITYNVCEIQRWKDTDFSSFTLSFCTDSKLIEEKLFKRKPENYINTFRITLEILLSNLNFTYDLSPFILKRRFFSKEVFFKKINTKQRYLEKLIIYAFYKFFLTMHL